MRHLQAHHLHEVWALAVKLDRDFGYAGMPSTVPSKAGIPGHGQRGKVRLDFFSGSEKVARQCFPSETIWLWHRERRCSGEDGQELLDPSRV